MTSCIDCMFLTRTINNFFDCTGHFQPAFPDRHWSSTSGEDDEKYLPKCRSYRSRWAQDAVAYPAPANLVPKPITARALATRIARAAVQGVLSPDYKKPEL